MPAQRSFARLLFCNVVGSCLTAFWGWLLRRNKLQTGVKMGPRWLPGGLLERSGRPLGALLDGPRTAKTCSWTALGRSRRNSKRGFSHLGGQKAPRKEAKSLPNRAQVATRAESAETLKFEGGLRRKPYFSGPEGSILGGKIDLKCRLQALADHVRL